MGCMVLDWCLTYLQHQGRELACRVPTALLGVWTPPSYRGIGGGCTLPLLLRVLVVQKLGAGCGLWEGCGAPTHPVAGPVARPGESASIRHHGEAPRPAAVRGELSGSRAGCAGGDVRSGRAAGPRGGARPGAAAWAAVRGEGWGRGLARRGGGASFTRSSAAAPWGSRSPLWRRCGVAAGAGRLPERLRNAAAPRSSAVRGPPRAGG